MYTINNIYDYRALSDFWTSSQLGLLNKNFFFRDNLFPALSDYPSHVFVSSRLKSESFCLQVDLKSTLALNWK